MSQNPYLAHLSVKPAAGQRRRVAIGLDGEFERLSISANTGSNRRCGRGGRGNGANGHRGQQQAPANQVDGSVEEPKTASKKRTHAESVLHGQESKGAYLADVKAGPGRLPMLYGNYTQYYARRRQTTTGAQSGIIAKGEAHLRRAGSSMDPRIACLPGDWFDAKRVLDVGCNAGAIVVDIGARLSPTAVVGVDIDPYLIDKANGHLRYAYSRLRTVPVENVEKDIGYFPESFPELFGNIPWVKPSDMAEAEMDTAFPWNVSFQTNDWALSPADPAIYDVILCLSVSKWVHLHHGDDGILALFRKAYSHLAPGGWFVLEPQPWSRYHRSTKLCQEIKRVYEEIRLRPDMFKDILLGQIGFTRSAEFQPDSATAKGFQRPIFAFQKPVA